MRLLNRLFDRHFDQDQFAQWIIKRLRASGETATIEYDKEQFRLSKSEDWHFFLHNFYQQYLRLPKSEHEELIRSFLATWHTTAMKAPEDFDSAKADLLPALRARSFLEVDIHRAHENYRAKMNLPHQLITEHLVATLVYDLPQSMRSVEEELLDKWDVSFYEAMEVALQNLREKTTQYAQLGSLYAVAIGDAYDASRLLLTDFIQQMAVSGETIAMVPNRERLYVCGSDDAEGLAAMAKFATEDLEHERFIAGLAFRLVDGHWETWLPPEDHPSYAAFRLLEIQTLGREYSDQKDLLDKRHEKENIDVFVATYSAVEDQQTGRLSSYCIWSEGIDSLLPRTDQIYLLRPSEPQDTMLVASADWDTMRNVAGDLMERQDMYPERWRVREFPSEAVLKEIEATAP